MGDRDNLETRMHDENRLRADLVAVWGEYGAHVLVFDHMLKLISTRDAAVAEAVAEERRLLTDLVVAADRMRDGWAESDEAVKVTLWRNLHTAAEAAYGIVYPLPGEQSLSAEQVARFEAAAERGLAARRLRSDQRRGDGGRR